MKFSVFVPLKGTYLSDLVAAGSAIIKARSIGDNRVLVYYEGNVYGAENINRFEDKCMVAAGRAKDRYPTTAMTATALSELIDIGIYDLESNTFELDETYHDVFRDWTKSTCIYMAQDR